MIYLPQEDGNRPKQQHDDFYNNSVSLTLFTFFSSIYFSITSSVPELSIRCQSFGRAKRIYIRLSP